jgi:hypothetical protein
MGSFGGAIGNANFQEPSSPDQTSATSMPDQTPQQQGQTQGLAAALGRRKKKAGGPTVKPPGPLAAAIARAKRARPSSQKYG